MSKAFHYIIINDIKLEAKKEIKDNQIKGLKELYNLREENLNQVLSLLNNPYMKDINKKYMIKIQKQSLDLFNLLTDIVSFIDDPFSNCS